MATSPRRLADALRSKALARIVLHLATRPGEPVHLRGLQRHVRIGTKSAQDELERLTEWGVLTRRQEGRSIRYHLNEQHPRWRALLSMVQQFADPVEVLTEAFSHIPGVEAAFLFGSTARGEAREDSDMDVFVLGDSIPLASLGRATAATELLTGRVLDVKTFTRPRLQRALEHDGANFAREALEGPKQWIAGSTSALPMLA